MDNLKASWTGKAVPWLSDLPPTAVQTWSAFAVGAVAFVAFLAVVPFSQIPLGRLNVFFPLLDAPVFVTDMVTAVLLFSQFAISGSRPLHALATGYLFTAFIVVPHALTFTGAFSPTDLLGANIQTGSWLFIFWHLGFALALLAYALFGAWKLVPIPPARRQSAIFLSVIFTAILVCCLTWLATAGTYLLPPIILDARRMSPIVIYPIWITILISTLAFVLLASRRRSVLDQWLMVVAFVYIGELILSGLLPSVRFSFGFYAARAFSIVAASIILVILLAETTRLYVLLARSHATLQREQDNKLMSFEAIVAAISHEVRQPLGTIELNGSSARLMLDRVPVDIGQMREIVDETIDAAERIDNTLSGLRSLFGKMDDRREQVDMNEVVVHALKLLHTELGTQGISVHMDLAADLPTIHGNSNQLHQLIYNLAHNAAEALSEARTGRGTIEIATRTQKGSIIVEVQDNGPGIDADKIESAFEPFVTSKKHGMGLGLAICRKIAERHGGQIGAMPVRPQGTRVRVQLERRDNTRLGKNAKHSTGKLHR